MPILKADGIRIICHIPFTEYYLAWDYALCLARKEFMVTSKTRNLYKFRKI